MRNRALASRPLVKVCGVTSEEDGRFALSSGADLLGFILAKSPRRVTAHLAAELVAALREGYRGKRALMTGVFKDAPLGWLLKTCRQAEFDLVQLHGKESPEYVGQVAAGGFKVMKVVKKLGKPAAAAMKRYPEAWAFLLEPKVRGSWRGTARSASFRGARAAFGEHPRVGVAGNLSPRNVKKIVRAAGPHLWLVDAASSLESFPGVKDPAKVKAFIDGARS